jgi:hypothetical protein
MVATKQKLIFLQYSTPELAEVRSSLMQATAASGSASED